MNEYRLAEPALMVIFGATGDLSGRKLLPALFNLARNRLLPAGFALVGAALDDLPEGRFPEWAGEHIKEHSPAPPAEAPTLNAFLSDLTSMPIDFSAAEGFQRLRQSLSDLARTRHTGGNVVFYCATPPSTYPMISEQLRAAGLNRGRGYRRIIVEKPFGSDLHS